MARVNVWSAKAHVWLMHGAIPIRVLPQYVVAADDVKRQDVTVDTAVIHELIRGGPVAQ